MTVGEIVESFNQNVIKHKTGLLNLVAELGNISNYVGAIKGVGRIYQQTFVDTYSKWAAAKLYTTKTPITGADLLNDRVLPFFVSQEMGIIRCFRAIFRSSGSAASSEKNASYRAD
jgi:hypothetical protein